MMLISRLLKHGIPINLKELTSPCIHSTRSSRLISCIIKGNIPNKNCSIMATTTKPKVYVTRKINPEALEALKSECEVDMWEGPGPIPRTELIKNLNGKSALFCMLTDKIDKELLDTAGQSLKLISTMSAGYDHLNIEEIRKRGIKIGYTGDVLADATAELTLAVLLATSRRLIESSEEARNGGWASWSPFWMCGYGLAGSTVGIVGFGRIGQEVAKRIKSFNPKQIVYFNRSEKTKEATALSATKLTFAELLKQSDFIIVTISLSPDTNLFNDEAFGMMKPTSVFVNTARGAVVDQDALVRALENKKIFAAGLDVTTPEPLPLSHPLFKLKNCFISPHIGSATYETRNNMAMLCVQNIVKGLKNEKMPAELI